MGIVTDGIIRPAIWSLEKLGLTHRFVNAFAARHHRRTVAKNPFRTYVPTSHDVFVAAYVKSGTNWMMQMAHQLVNHGRGDYEHIHSVVSWPDIALMGPGLRHYAIPVDDPSVWMASPEQKRVIKTHYDWELLPYSEAARYISVIRDPKDVFVSSYFFFVTNSGLSSVLSVDTWLKLFVSDHFPMWGSWATNTASYWAKRDRPNVLVVSFKSMTRDLRGTVQRVAHVLDIHVSDEVIDRVCEQSSFEYMKRIDDKFRVWKLNPWGPEGPMIRKGVQGGSSELLNPAQQRQVDDYFRAELKRLGSDFPYDEFCDVSPAG